MLAPHRTQQAPLTGDFAGLVEAQLGQSGSTVIHAPSEVVLSDTPVLWGELAPVRLLLLCCQLSQYLQVSCFARLL